MVDLNPGPCCYEATELTIAPPCMRVTFQLLLTTSLCECFEILSFPIWCMENPWIHALTLSRAGPAGCLRLSALIWLGQLWHLAHTRAHTLIQAYTFFSLFPMHLTLSLAMWCMLMKAEAHVVSEVQVEFNLLSSWDCVYEPCDTPALSCL